MPGARPILDPGLKRDASLRQREKWRRFAITSGSQFRRTKSMRENYFRPPGARAIAKIDYLEGGAITYRGPTALRRPRPAYFLVKTKCFSMFAPTASRCLQYALKPPL